MYCFAFVFTHLVFFVVVFTTYRFRKAFSSSKDVLFAYLIGLRKLGVVS